MDQHSPKSTSFHLNHDKFPEIFPNPPNVTKFFQKNVVAKKFASGGVGGSRKVILERRKSYLGNLRANRLYFEYQWSELRRAVTGI